jgi:hypothetical protein
MDSAEEPNDMKAAGLNGRADEIAAAFAAIRTAIEALRGLDLAETHPAVVFRPISGKSGR